LALSWTLCITPKSAAAASCALSASSSSSIIAGFVQSFSPSLQV
jgi:hypothetical protein